MTSTAIVPIRSNPLLIEGDTSKDRVSRLTMFADWLNQTGGEWAAPNLAAYRDYLRSDQRTVIDRRTGERKSAPPLSAQATSTHLATIRGRYQAIVGDNALRDYLQLQVPDGSLADQHAWVEDKITRLQNAIHPKQSAVKVIVQQDRTDASQTRLTREQGEALLEMPGKRHGLDKLHGLRDTALLALALCTGLREGELAALDVADLRQHMDGKLSLHVRKGKG